MKFVPRELAFARDFSRYQLELMWIDLIQPLNHPDETYSYEEMKEIAKMTAIAFASFLFLLLLLLPLYSWLVWIRSVYIA